MQASPWLLWRLVRIVWKDWMRLPLSARRNRALNAPFVWWLFSHQKTGWCFIRGVGNFLYHLKRFVASVDVWHWAVKENFTNMVVEGSEYTQPLMWQWPYYIITEHVDIEAMMCEESDVVLTVSSVRNSTFKRTLEQGTYGDDDKHTSKRNFTSSRRHRCI